MRNPWLARLLPLALLPACVVRLPDGEGDDEIGETADESTDASEATSTGTDTSEVTSESTDETDTADETDTSNTTDTTDTGTDECPPLPESPADFDYQIDIGGAMGPQGADITWACTLIEHDTLDGLMLTLDCPDELVTLSVLADPLLNPPLMNGAAITLRYVTGPSSPSASWFSNYLRLDMDGFGHLFTIIEADSIEPPNQFELPFPITVVSGICDPGPDDCGTERLGLAFELGGEAIVMFDPTYAIVGGVPGTDVWVAEASRLHDFVCLDLRDEWFRVLIANTGWE